MKMNELIRYDVPPEMITLWRERESPRLLPLQEKVVKRHDLFGGGNLLIQAPTSSGKTFIGEMAAVQTALRRKKVVYLVPLKALAEEKFRDFQGKYGAYGLKVIISTRDHRAYDRELEDGDFSVAVVVYEKLAQLLVRRPERIEEMELIIADELELLSDPERGASAELLLTRVLQSSCRLIGLSAVVGEAERLAGWMKAELVQYERRPVELRYGVLHDGRFRYRTYNEEGEGEEPMSDMGGETPWEMLTWNVCEMVARGESCLIFVKAKHESRRGAELLAERISLPAASRGIETLRGLEPTRSRDTLLQTLQNGVAFHNADLSPAERDVVERAFREGEAQLLVSTSTLAVGMNLPAQNVFLTADRWRYDARLGLPWKTPISRSEYENMSGRAGRYGAGHAFGRSILVAATPFDQETFWRRYIEGTREGIEPRLARDALENHVLRLVASRFCRNAKELAAFLEQTLTGQWVWAETFTLDEVAFRVRAAVNRCADAGLLGYGDDDRLEVTPFGMAAASKGITLATARELEHWLQQCGMRDWHPLDLLFAAASAPDGRTAQVMLTAREYEHAGYHGQIKERMRHEPIEADTPLNRLRNCSLQPFFEEVRAIKTALFLYDWMEHVPVRELEDRYHTMAGQILSAAEQISWIIDAAAAIATSFGASAALVEKLSVLSERVAKGLEADALPLSRAAAEGTPRTLCMDLYAHGLHTPESLAKAPRAVLTQWMPAAMAKELTQWAHEQQQGADGAAPVAPESGQAEETAPPGNGPKQGVAAPVLVVDDARPGEILLEGTPVALQEKQYRLIRLLAAHPGECVPYETIYATLWGPDVFVENKQMHFQKRVLLKRIREAAPQHAGVVRTQNKRGFMLCLDHGEVLLKPSSGVSQAA